MAPLLSAVIACAVVSADEAVSSRPADAGEVTLRAEPLAPGVVLVRPVDPRNPARTNSLVVERSDGLLVVGAQPDPQGARELLSLLAQSGTSSPVRFLVLPEPHAEAAGGASAFPDETLVIGAEGCRAAMTDPDFDFGAEARRRIAGWQEPPRRSPVLTLAAPTTLHDPQQPVELFPLNPSHTSGDLLVRLPAAGVTYAGAILFGLERNPYGRDADVGGWLGRLSQMLLDPPQQLIPLRGGPEVGLDALRAQRDALAWIRGSVGGGFIDGLEIDRIRERALADPKASVYFDLGAEPCFVPALIDRAIEEALEERRKRGWED